MSIEFTEFELQQIANQLSRPDGADGILTAGRMAHTNNNMTLLTVEALQLAKGDLVLEIGPGNGTHVKDLVDNHPGVNYYGIDISDTMVGEANRINEEAVKEGKVAFAVTKPDEIAFESDFFDKIFTVNTLYFWEDPLAYAAEIKRVLKKDGVFCLSIATKEFMEGLPFTKYKFKLYDAEALSDLLKEAGFIIDNIALQKDLTTSHTGQAVDRDIIIARLRKE